MSSHKGLITRVIASVKALLPGDWQGAPGDRFRNTTQAISDFAEEHHITPAEILDQGVELGRRKLEGMASHEYAQALKNFAETEKVRTEAELQRRSLESEVSRRTAEAKKTAAEARLAEISVIKAEMELLRSLKEAGIALHRDVNGNLTALPSPPEFDLLQIAGLKKLPAPSLPDGVTLRRGRNSRRQESRRAAKFSGGSCICRE